MGNCNHLDSHSRPCQGDAGRLPYGRLGWVNPSFPDRIHPGKVRHVAEPDQNRYEIGFATSQLGQN